MNSRRSGYGRSEIQEGIQVNLIIEDANATAYDQVAFAPQLVGEP